MQNNDQRGEMFTGHGSEWRNAGRLSADEARLATSWVEARIDRRSMLTNKDRVEDVRDVMWQLEKDGEIVVHRVQDEHEPVIAKTLYGWTNAFQPVSSGITNPAANAATRRATRCLSCG